MPVTYSEKNKSIFLEICAGLILILFALFAYQNATKNGFHFDDYRNITDHGPIKIKELSLAALWGAATNGMEPRRVIPNLSFAIDWWRGGGSPRYFQQTNLAIHLLATLAVWRFFIAVLSAANFNNRSTLIITATASTLIWSVHPIQSQAVTYIVQRMSSFALLFSMLSIIAYINWRRSEKESHAWITLAVIFFVCAIASKENAWSLLAILILYEASISSRVNGLDPGRKRLVFIYILILMTLYFVVDIFSGGPLSSHFELAYGQRDFTMIERLLTQPRVILFHLLQWITPWPDNFSLYHDFEISKDLFTPKSTLYALAFSVLWVVSGIALLFNQKYSIYAFFILWLPITLAIESTIVPLEIIYEHRMYMPSVGLAALPIIPIAIMSQESATSKRIIFSSLLAVCVVLAVSTRSRVEDWKSEKSLIISALSHAQESARMWGNLGSVYASEGDIRNALDSLNRAISLDQDMASAYHNRGKIFADNLKDYDQALADFNMALGLEENKTKTLIERGNLYYNMGNHEDAWRDYSHAIELQKDHALAYYNRGLLSMRFRDMQTAIMDLERAASIEPGNSAIHGSLGAAYLGINNIRMALSSLERALSLDQKNALASFNYGRALAKAGRPGDAISAFMKSCQLGVARGCKVIQQAN